MALESWMPRTSHLYFLMMKFLGSYPKMIASGFFYIQAHLMGIDKRLKEKKTVLY